MFFFILIKSSVFQGGDNSASDSSCSSHTLGKVPVWFKLCS